MNLTSAQVLNTFPDGPAQRPAAPGFNPLAAFTNYPVHSKNPATNFYSFSIQRQIGQRHVVELGYLGSRAYHLFSYHQSNYAILTPGQAARVIATGNTGTASLPTVQQRRIYPEWGSRLLLETVSSSLYNAGYVKFDRRLARGLTIGANYTFSSSLGNGDGAFDRWQDERNSRLDYGRTALDRPHRFVVHYVWQTPGKGVLSGWRVSGISQWQSGGPFTVTTGVDSNGDGDTTRDRPDYNPHGRIALDPVDDNWRSFSTPLNGGGIFVTPLNAGGTPLLYSAPNGLSLMKPFRIAERIQLELRADAANAFNHRNFGPPVANMNNLNFGRNTSNPRSRVMLLGAKLRF